MFATNKNERFYFLKFSTNRVLKLLEFKNYLRKYLRDLRELKKENEEQYRVISFNFFKYE